MVIMKAFCTEDVGAELGKEPGALRIMIKYHTFRVQFTGKVFTQGPKIRDAKMYLNRILCACLVFFEIFFLC